MDGLLNPNPGLMIWTVISFSVILFLILKFGVRPIINAINNREEHLNSQLEQAEKANANAQKLLEENEERIANAQGEMKEIISNGRQQAKDIIDKANIEASEVARKRVEQAAKEIDREKQIAIKELRNEVADLVILATEKVINEKMTKEKDSSLIEKSIEGISAN
ncbi:MAG: ATP synthase F0 subunit B [Bacteroidetes bacterium 4572_77]|nr:MAG: ATP synthase F0 subunit B [Bacteroidetes bacterium 4572_77]